MKKIVMIIGNFTIWNILSSACRNVHTSLLILFSIMVLVPSNTGNPEFNRHVDKYLPIDQFLA